MTQRRPSGSVEAHKAPSPVCAPHSDFACVTKMELHAWADALAQGEPIHVQRCVDFVLAETRGLWHGRARAMLCRRLKHCGLGRSHRSALLACILGRLQTGNFSEQFKDQLRLALHLDPVRTAAAAQEGLASGKPHVRRYAAWVLSLAKSLRKP